MLRITLNPPEKWDNVKQEFVVQKGYELTLEHSLVSISKWESKWHKPFISREEKTVEQTVDYIKCMTLTQNVDPKIYDLLSVENIKQINEYIDDPMTATWFRDDKRGPHNSEQVTSELIYYWMIALEIPFECQKWHLNRLLTLIKVCNIKNQKPQKMSQKDIMSRNSALNAARRKQFNTRG